MLRATLNEPVPLQVLAADGRVDLFAQVTLLQDATTVAVFNLPHLNGGVYGTTWTPTAEGYYSARYQLFLDNLYAVAAPYDLESEIIEVSSDKTNIMRILGLQHENSVFDQQTFDGSGNLISGRVRVFKTKADALALNVSAVLFTYTVLATYTGGQLSKYMITRDS